ncbi:hypothetical protein KM481_gp27 [Harp seal herpesvirus]|uniref:Uncharacterized protein n=1 Tax=phocid gammaherpesvirus 3 TaxID=2560643 RepID=A0A0R5YYC5_9GAMA|nr:hypothetical protein KM481_gp27 [Harp seal herpesvirus]AJG42957.1 hypothetical protein [Harp seal herpesvirus]
MRYYHENLRKFLNKECIWCKYDTHSKFVKMYHASTAISPNYKPRKLQDTYKSHAMNISMIFLKPKNKPTYVTVFLNGVLMACCVPDYISIKAVPGEHDMFLVYLGPFLKLPPETAIPSEIKISSFEDGLMPLKSEIWDTSFPIAYQDIEATLSSWEFTCIGKCVWYGKSSILQYFLSIDYMMCCPSFREYPSFGRLVNLVTRCTNEDCVPCYGKKVHVNVKGGFTPHYHDGTSISCPCVFSCAALKSNTVPITGNKNILTLFFGPEKHLQVVSLKFTPTDKPCKITDLCCGLTSKGKEIPLNPEAWQLLRMSDFFSRTMLYACQILKRRCLE